LTDPDGAHFLLLIELGAQDPSWLDSSAVHRLDQGANESPSDFIDRALSWLKPNPGISTVVVALRTDSTPGLEERVQSQGQRLVAALDSRPRARLLFDAPSCTSERQRHRLLGLTADLAQHEAGQRACVVGAHFSANPPSSSRIPALRG